MALQRQTYNLNFIKGLDTKPDKNQLAIGSFRALSNCVFDVLGRLTKRDGFGAITSLPIPGSFLTTFKENLTAIGTTLQSYSQGSNTWVNSGAIQPLQLSVLPLIRNSVNQTQVDAVTSSNGLVCTVYSETVDGSNFTHKYAVADATTGQNILPPTLIASDATYGTPRVFVLGTYFVIVYINHPSAYNLKYMTINSANLIVGTSVTLSTSITPASTVAFDGIVYNNSLYLAWNGASASGIKALSISSTLSVSSVVNPDASHQATIVSVCADVGRGNIWISYYNSSGTVGYTLALNANLSTVLAATAIISPDVVLNMTSSAQNGVNTVFYEVSNNYGYDSSIPTHYVNSKTITIAGVVSGAVTIIRSLGLASKSFIINGQIYFMGAYQSSYQPTYFIISAASRAAAPIVIAKLAYGNGGGYLTTGLPSALVSGTTVQIGYLFKDLVQAVNKNTNVPSGNQVAGVYAQLGINFASFNFTTVGLSTADIGNNLHLSGGFLWMYDGYVPVEHNFFLYPDNVEATNATTGGNLSAQVYFYQFVYRWTDNQGNVFRSAPSIPLKVDLSGTGTSTNNVTLSVPYLRLTYKTANPPVLEGYRWSQGQQSYYQVTSIIAPTVNSTTGDYVNVVDGLADASILGNNLLYTTGGVEEDSNAGSFNAMTLFDTRLWGILAEDPNVLQFSKTVIEATPVEIAQEGTIYVSPTTAENKSTGPMKCIFPMDDKLIIFKRASLVYINGTGPDITGNNSQYSEPTGIASPVGSTNFNSIVLIPDGLMFQSDGAGIWLLNRALQVEYIGAPVQEFNSATVLSVVKIPKTTRVVFTLSTGVSLMYDFYARQWGTFSIGGISSTIYNNLHTFMTAPVTVVPPSGPSYVVPSQVLQQTPGLYVDNGLPVTISFTTGWISLAGLQGFKRCYWMELLANYVSPHNLIASIAYDFNPSVVQAAPVAPDNYSPPWGSDSLYGQSTPYGGNSTVEQWQINFARQTCQSFQLTMTENYDPSFGAAAGAGLTISAIDLVVGLKKGYPKNIPAAHRTG